MGISVSQNGVRPSLGVNLNHGPFRVNLGL